MMWVVNANPDASQIETSLESFEVAKMHRHAVLLVRNVFSSQEIRAIRERVEAVVRRAYRDRWYSVLHERYPAGRVVQGDLLGMEELRDLDYIAFDRRVLACARRVLGEELVYFGDSSIRVGFYGRGFHQDFVDETDPIRGAVRFALYLQDHSLHSGGLKVRLGSHRYLSRHRGTMIDVPTRVGDLVLFYLHSSHTGNNVRLRGLPELCLHPKVESLVPRILRAPEQKERVTVLWTFGVKGAPYLDRYLKWITRHPEHWERSGYDQRLVELAHRKGVGLIKAHPRQGSLLPNRDGPRPGGGGLDGVGPAPLTQEGVR